jgi:hypothetical protein
MFRAGVVVAILGLAAAGARDRSSAAWPLRASITDSHGRSTTFRAITLGGELIVSRGGAIRPLAAGDTLSATTPWSFPMDLRGGPVVFFSGTGDSLRVVVGRNPYGLINAVTAQGRRLTVRLVRDSIVIDAR